MSHPGFHEDICDRCRDRGCESQYARIAELEAERDGFMGQRDSAVQWSERYMAERDAAIAERDEYKRLAVPAVFEKLKQERDAALGERDMNPHRWGKAETELRQADARALELRREVAKWIGAAEDAGAEANGLAVQLDAALAEAKRFEALMVRRDAELDAERAKEWNVLEARAEAKALRDALECIRSHHTFEDWRVALELASKALAAHPEPSTVCPECGVSPGHSWCGRVGGPVTPEPKLATVTYPVLPVDPEADARIEALMARQPRREPKR